MKVRGQTLSRINEVLDELIRKYPPQSEETALTDICFQFKSDSGELLLFNDDDEEIATAIVDEWANGKDDDCLDKVENTLRLALDKRHQEIESLGLLRPYSMLLVDENKETLCELYLVDDNTLIFDSETLMKDLEKDLDNFIKRLLEE